MRNRIGYLYDSEKVTFGELLLKAKRNEDKEMLVKVTSKSSVIESEAKGDLEEKVDKLLAVAKSGQMGNGKDKRDRSRTPKLHPLMQGKGLSQKEIVNQTSGIVSKAQEKIFQDHLKMGRNSFNVSNARGEDIPEGCAHHI